MFPDHATTAAVAALCSIALASSACSSSSGSSTPPMTTQQDSAQAQASLRPRVKFKGHKRLGRDLALALDLEREALCMELSRYDCLDEVHHIALGGVDPYRLGIDEPLDLAPVTAPIAADRVALSACAERAKRDLAAPRDATVFKEASAQGAPSEDALGAMGARLYRKLLGRQARPEEVAVLVGFWDEVATIAASDPMYQWSTMSCFILATSLEFLFY